MFDNPTKIEFFSSCRICYKRTLQETRIMFAVRTEPSVDKGKHGFCDTKQTASCVFLAHGRAPGSLVSEACVRFPPEKLYGPSGGRGTGKAAARRQVDARRMHSTPSAPIPAVGHVAPCPPNVISPIWAAAAGARSFATNAGRNFFRNLVRAGLCAVRIRANERKARRPRRGKGKIDKTSGWGQRLAFP